MLGWRGPASLVVLGPPARGSAPARVLTLDAGQPYAPLMVVPPDMSRLPAGASLEFSVSGADGALLWSRSLTVEEIRRHVAASGTVALLIPAGILPSGACHLHVREAAEGRDLMTARFEVVRPK
jgi:hypothetical protein